jgi:hypothetical protein
MNILNEHKLAIQEEINNFQSKGGLFLFELEIVNDEYLLVDLDLTEKGIEFSFDSDNKPCSFDEEIETIHDNRYLLPFDSDSYYCLDNYLEMIHDNLLEGYLSPNNLYR